MPLKKSIRNPSIALTVLFSFLILPALASAQGAAASERPAVRRIDHERIHIGDILEIDLVGSVEGDWRGQLGPDGLISGYSFIADEVYALCRSADEVASELESKLMKTFRDPKVRVSVVDRSRRTTVSLSGAVRNPHRFQVKRKVRLRELLILAGGLSATASGTLQIYRPGGLSCAAVETSDGPCAPGKGEFVEISLTDLLAGDPDADPEIGSGDVITVLQAAPVYVVGGVSRPTQIATREELTVSRAISIAGGLAKNGDARRVRLFRSSEVGERATEIDLTKIGGSSKDPILRPFDVVEVPEKSRKASDGRPFIRADELIRQQQGTMPLIIVD